VKSLARFLALAWISAVLLLVVINILAPQRAGLFALTEVFEPFVVLAALLAMPLALIGRTRAGSLVVAVLLVLALGRYLPGWISVPAGGEPRLTAATWNVLGGSGGALRTLEGVLATETDLVALVELQPRAVELLEAEPVVTSRWPYRLLAPDPGLFGSGLMSRYPITDGNVFSDPDYLRAQVELPDATVVVVYVIHPPRPGVRTVWRLPVGLETAVRDAELDAIREAVERDLVAGRTVMVAGDFNTTEREPAYIEFASGLRDAHLDAGVGPGFTWRPEGLEGLPFGVVRIDYLLTSADLQATATHVVCNHLSDHCRLIAAFK
jgi:vancomycin resistance protein VanJ